MSSIIRDKIVRVLTIYPKISRSMLHTGIGPAIPKDIWQPELARLISDGVVQEAKQQCEGREYSSLSLTDRAVKPELRTV